VSDGSTSPPPTPPLKGRGGGLVKHSLTIAGHRTSLSLEPVFWSALQAAAAERGQPLNALVAEIDEARTTNLSSAVRVWLFDRALAQSKRASTTSDSGVSSISSGGNGRTSPVGT